MIHTPYEAPHWDAVPGDAERTLREIDRWSSSEELARLVRAFGGVASGDGDARLAYLDGFSARSWDFRGGRERNLGLAPRFSPVQRAAAAAAVSALGLLSTVPPRKAAYDTVLMTGGMVRAGIVKPRHLRTLLDRGLSVSNVVFLGAFRPFAGDEAALAAKLGVVGDNEVDAMRAGLDVAFGPLGEPHIIEALGENPFASWQELSWRRDSVKIAVLAAPSSRPEARRANTADTFRFWAGRRSEAERSVLVTTTSAYVPYQGAVAVEIFGLEYGLAVETIAVSSEANDLGALSQPFTTAHQLQEIRSGIRGMRSLRTKLLARVVT